jgi:hypothetical protein
MEEANMSLSIKVPFTIILILISSITIISFYYNLDDIYYGSLNDKINKINLQIENNILNTLVKGNLTEFYDINNKKIRSDIIDNGLLRKRYYYENSMGSNSLIAMDYYGINNELVKREFLKDGNVVHRNYYTCKILPIIRGPLYYGL